MARTASCVLFSDRTDDRAGGALRTSRRCAMTRNLGTRLLQAAAVGSTGVALTGGALVGVLMTEAKLARHWVGAPKGEPPAADGRYGSGRNPEISLVMLGDSMAAGLGVASAEETPAALIATGLAERADAPVRLTNVALVGAQST